MNQPMPQMNLAVGLVLIALAASIFGAWIWVVLRIAFRKPILPPNTPTIVPWGPFSVLAALMIWIATQVAVPAAFRAAKAGPVGPDVVKPAAPPGLLMTFSAVSNAATLVLVPLALAVTAGATRRDFGVRLAGLGRQVARGVVCYPLLAPIVFGMMLLSVLTWGRTAHPLETAIGLDKSAGMASILVLAGVVLAPFAEELIFRGVLLGWLTRVALGLRAPSRRSGGLEVEKPAPGPDLPPTPPDLVDPEPDSEVSAFDAEGGDASNPYAAPTAPVGWREFAGIEPAPKPNRRALPLFLANAIVSVVFAALHAPVWPTPIPIFFLSLGLGLLYQRTGSILAPIALHMTFNGVSTLIMFLASGSAAPANNNKGANPIPSPASASIRVDFSENRRFRAEFV